MSQDPQHSSIQVAWPRPDTALASLDGEHDLAGSERLRSTLRRLVDNGANLVVDVSSMTYMDSTTIAVLMATKAHADERDRRFNLLIGTAPIVERLLEITGVLAELNAVRTLDEALPE